MITREGPSLEEVTIECFGETRGRDLLRRGAVHPIRGFDRKTPGYRGWNEPYTQIRTTDFLALGLMAGPLAGITVWDADTADLIPPVPPNLKTSRGWHIYTAYAGEHHLQRGVRKLDVVSNGNAVFWDREFSKTFAHGELADAGVMHAFWEGRAGRPVVVNDRAPDGNRTRTRSCTRGKGETGTCAIDASSGYVERVVSAGYVVDVPRVLRGCQLQVRGAAEGTRNTVLHRKALELIHLGADPWQLEEAALFAGLKPGEVEDVIERTLRLFDPERIPEVMAQAGTWAKRAMTHVRPSWCDLVSEVVRMAIEQNTLRPMVTTGLVRSSVTRSTTSRRLQALVNRDLLERIKLAGRRSNGLSRSHCYALICPTSAGGDDA